MTDLPIAYGGCRCICHRRAGVRHFMACCGPHSLVQRVEQARATPTASGLEAAQDVDRLRVALIACGRHAGALFSDEVSTDFLMHVPEEVRLKIASLDRPSSHLRLIAAARRVEQLYGMDVPAFNELRAALRTDPAGEKSGG